jgi:hypothetical protein
LPSSMLCPHLWQEWSIRVQEGLARRYRTTSGRRKEQKQRCLVD